MTIITRLGYCPHCERNRNPRGGQIFLAYGSTFNKYHVLIAQNNGVIGYTPHIYKLEKVIGRNVIVLKSCAMYPCGVKREAGDYFSVRAWEREVWTLETWNALVNLKHNWFTKRYEI